MSRTIRNPAVRRVLAQRRLVRRTLARNVNHHRRTDPMGIMRESDWYSAPDPWPPRPKGDPGQVYRELREITRTGGFYH